MNFDLINFNPFDIEESDETARREYEQCLVEQQRNTYIDSYNNSDNPVSFIDGSYKPDDMKSYLEVKNQYCSDDQFYTNLLKFAKEESPNAFNILRDYKDVFQKRLEIYEDQYKPQTES